MSKRRIVPDKHPSPSMAGMAAVSWPPLGVPAGILLIAAAVLIAYYPSINGAFVLDDGLVLAENNSVKAADGLYRFWCTHKEQDYWPTTYSMFWLEWRLWDRNPSCYHVTALLLHILETLLIWIILQRLAIPGAFLAALIFAIHPVNVQSVAWIAELKNVAAMLFFLLSILWYLRERKSPHAFSPWYWLSLAAFVLAMLGKGSTLVLPLVLVAVAWWFRPLEKTQVLSPAIDDRPRTAFSPFFRRDVLPIVPFFAVALGLALVNVWFQTHGTDVVYRHAAFADRLAGAGGVIWFYLYKALLPLDLCFVYPMWRIEATNPLWWAPLLAALAVAATLWLYRKSWGRPFLFAWAFFCAALAPVMGFIDVGFMKFSLVADHYQHIAIIGVIALVSAGLTLWRGTAGKTSRAALSLAAVAAAVLMLLTWRQSSLFSGEIPLYQDTLKKNPQCWRIQDNLGIAMLRAGRVQEAVDDFQRVLELNPDFIEARNNLGNALFQAGRAEQAIEQIRQALSLKPDFPAAHFNLGKIFLSLGRTPEALDQFQESARQNPDFPDAHFYLGNILFAEGQAAEAIEQYRQAVRLKPDFWAAHNALANALAKTGNFQEAIEHFQQALQLKADLPEAWFELANAYKALGQYQQAIEFYGQALALQPDYLEAHNNLGIVLFQTNQAADAIEHFKQVLRLSPDDINAYNNLASAYASLRQSSEALAAAQKALELARSKGQPALAERIEMWLNAYRASLSRDPGAQKSNSVHPRP